MDFRLLSNCHFRALRKEKFCIWCAEKMEIGSSAKSETVIFHDEFRVQYFHEECFDAMKQVVKESNGPIEWGPGDYRRGCAESRA